MTNINDITIKNRKTPKKFPVNLSLEHHP